MIYSDEFQVVSYAINAVLMVRGQFMRYCRFDGWFASVCCTDSDPSIMVRYSYLTNIPSIIHINAIHVQCVSIIFI